MRWTEVLAVVFALIFVPVGCYIGNATGPVLDRERTATTIGSDGKPTAITIEKIHAQGPSVPGENAKSAKFAPVTLEPNGKVTAGGGNIDFYSLLLANGMRPLLILGGVCIVAGVVLGWLVGWGLGLCVSAGGVALIGTAVLFQEYPWVALLPVVIGLVALVWGVVGLVRGKNVATALTTVVKAVESLPSAHKETVTEAVAQAANITGTADVVKAQVTAIKGA